MSEGAGAIEVWFEVHEDSRQPSRNVIICESYSRDSDKESFCSVGVAYSLA